MSYIKENSIVYKNYLERNWFASWSLPRGESINGLKAIEIYLTTDCNLACKYCYLNRHEDKLYPKEHRADDNKILENVGKILRWLKRNKYTPGLEFFSGSPLSSELGLKTLKLLYEFYKDVPLELRPPFITVPTNYTFLLDIGLESKVKYLLKLIRELDIDLRFSASIDGKLLEENRPFRAFDRLTKGLYRPETDTRDDEFYDKVFQFNKETNFGFHPMVYSHKIENWKDNFLWFQDMFEKHGFHFSSVYMLEVRNMEWSKKQMKEYEEFIDFLIKWSFDKVGKDVNAFLDFLFKGRGYNILTNTTFKKSRGTTCGLQTQLYVRVGDLSIVGCHRQSYNGYEFAKMIVEDDEIVDIEARNLDMAITQSSFDSKTLPYCQTCVIKEVCMGGCMGANIEYNGDPFVNIPTVCELIHRKIIQIIKSLKSIGVYEAYYNRCDIEVKRALDSVSSSFENRKGDSIE